MRILALSEHYRQILGGSSAYVRNLCRQLAREGHEVYLITEQDDDSYPLGAEWNWVDGYRVRNATLGMPLDGNTRSGRRVLTRSIRKQLKHELSELRPDVVHVLFGMTLAHILEDVPQTSIRVWSIMNVPPQEYAFGRFAGVPLVNEFFKRCYFSLARSIHSRNLREIPYDRLVCISNQTRESALAVGVAPEQTVAIPLGIDPDVFVPMALDRKTKESLGGGAPLILCVAGVVPHKGQLDMVEAMPTIAHHWPGARFVNIGATRYRHYYAQVKSRARELGVEDRCFFGGHVPFEDLLLYYNACDIYVQPSHQEGFCMAALQAISCGKTIIGTPVGGMAEFIQGSRAGALVPCKSPSQIAEAVVRLLGSPFSVDPYAQHAYVAQNYSWQVVARKTVALYQSVRHLNGVADSGAI